jgi:hypothetical protein
MIVLPTLVLCGLIAMVFLSIEAGYRLGNRRRLRMPQEIQGVNRMVESSVFALMGLLIGFTFYGAGARFDARRNLIVRETNAIGTTYLRLDLLPPEIQPELRQDFRTYVHSRLDVYRNVADIKALKSALDRSSALQQNIWNKTVEATKVVGPAEKSLVLTTLNEMIDITTEQAVALVTHPPPAVFVMLALTVITSSALVGYTMGLSAVRDWVSTAIFALTVSIALYVILDYEFPRIGFIRIDPVDQVLIKNLQQLEQPVRTE